MRKTYEVHRLTTANGDRHDFADVAMLAAWWEQNNATAGVTVYHKLVIVESLEAVFPTMPAPIPPAKAPAITVTNVNVTQHAWGTTSFPTVG